MHMAKESPLPPFFRAARLGKLSQLECYLKAGVSPNAFSAVQLTQAGDTALFTAVLGEQPAVIQLLLQYGAEINSPNSVLPT